MIDHFKNEPFDFAPNERFLYNNSGYFLLGAIIEKVTGKTYDEFLRERIIEPLGLTGTRYGSNESIIPRRAKGYSRDQEGKIVNSMFLSMSQPYSAGSLLSTVDDLAKWTMELFDGNVVRPDSMKQMITPHTLNNGEKTGYGFGFLIGDLKDREMIHHGGGIFGFTCHEIYLPDEDIFVAVLTNFDRGASPAYVAQKIAAIAVGDPYEEYTEIELPAETLEKYAGTYRISENEARILTVEDGKMYSRRGGGQRLQLFPASEELFFFKGTFTYVTFDFDDLGNVTSMTAHYADGSESVATKE
jgi:CubicO group peptidase (beta-lactamase class C family)